MNQIKEVTGDKPGTAHPRNLVRTRRKPGAAVQVAEKAPEEAAGQTIILEGFDLEKLMTPLKVRALQQAVSDQVLLGCATNFFCTLDDYLDRFSKMPEAKMGLLHQPPSSKLDITACLLAARELKEMATEYAFNRPVMSERDVAMKQVAAAFAGAGENFLFVSSVEHASGELAREKAAIMGGMVVDTKNELRGLITQYSMMALPVMQKPAPKGREH